MKKRLLGLCFLLLCIILNAQNGLENVIVEKYYVSDAADEAASIGNLPVGSVTYRIFVDMLPDYKFQMAYGDAVHPLSINTSTTFFNNEDRGNTTPAYTKTHARSNTVMLDSWVSAGAACSGNFGILKSEDDGVSTVVNSDGILANTDPTAGIALTVQDGLIVGTPGQCGLLGIDTQIEIFNATSQAGNSFTINDGAWYCLDGAIGPNADNKVLIAQITTEGDFTFELNIQLGTPSGGIEKYVANNPEGDEIEFEDLSYPIYHVESVLVNPATASIVVNDTKQLSVTISPSNATNKAVTWSSGNTSVATVSSAGLVTGVTPGIATISVTSVDGNKTASCNITVTNSSVAVTGVAVAPATASIAVENTVQLTATISPSDATNSTVSWESANTAVATVSSTGLVTGVSPGTTDITVTTEDENFISSCLITVESIAVESISVEPASATIVRNGTQQLSATILPANATDKSVSWSTGNSAVATVNSSGLVTGISSGTVSITVTSTDGNKTANSTITVTIPVTQVTVSPVTANLTLNGTQQLTESITPSDATNKSVSWSSSNTSIATVSTDGLVTGIAQGTAQVTVTTHDGNLTDNCTISVSPSSLQNYSKNHIEIFPNPVEDFLTVSNLSGNYIVKVFDLAGNLIKEQAGQNTIDTYGMTKGIYLVEITNENEVAVLKIVKK